jgi:hypothetical protein
MTNVCKDVVDQRDFDVIHSSEFKHLLSLIELVRYPMCLHMFV